jgi:hypothetical protein
MIKLFNGLPLGSSTAIDRLDLFTGNGIAKTFLLTKKTGLRLATTVVAGASSWFRDSGTLTVSGDTFTTSTAPINTSVVIAPGLTRAQWRVYDEETIPGITNPNQDIIRLILADIDEIGVQSYAAAPDEDGLKVSVIDKDTDNGALPEWVAFAPENPDGSMGTFGAAGAAITFPDLVASSFLSAAASALDTEITVDDGSAFQEGTYITVGYGTANNEFVRITEITGNVLTVTGLEQDHDEDEPVLENGWPFYARIIVPAGITGGVSATLYDLGLDILMDVVSR